MMWMWNAVLGLLGLTLLATCSNNNPLPPTPYTGWAITEYGVDGVQRVDAHVIPYSTSFAIPGGPLATNWISYVEHPTGAISGNLAFSWTITGDNPVFEFARPDNTCGGQASLSLLFRSLGRFFSLQRVPLALGTFTLSVPLTSDKWVNQDGGVFNPAAAQTFGFGLGGGCFAAHGVAVSSGSAFVSILGEGAN